MGVQIGEAMYHGSTTVPQYVTGIGGEGESEPSNQDQVIPKSSPSAPKPCHAHPRWAGGRHVRKSAVRVM
jgi:hypothetical protein